MNRKLFFSVAVASVVWGAPAAYAQEATPQGEVYIDPDTGPGAEETCPPGQVCPGSDQVVIDPDTGPGPEQPPPGASGQPLPDNQQAGEEGIKPDGEPSQTGSVSPELGINDDQAAEIRTAITGIQIEPVEVDFQINIGIAIPQTVVLHPLPSRIVEVVPAYRDYQFFMLADGTIVIVDPATWRVVYVLHA